MIVKFDRCFEPIIVCILKNALIDYIKGSAGHQVPGLCLNEVKI